MDQPLALIIEDQQDLALVFGQAVQAAGFQIETFHDGENALQRLSEVKPYLVVLDLHLPGITGRDILEHIRTKDELKDIKVIIASADDQLGELLRDQANIVLLKPISFVQIKELSQRLLKKRS